MAYLDRGAKSAGLYEDLDFIRKKLRYPLRKALLWRPLAWGSLIAVLFLFTAFRLSSEPSMWGSRRFFAGLMPLILSVPLIAGVVRYLRSLKFAVLSTALDTAGNRRVLERFLQAQQLQVINHPLSKDIFQIVSVPVSSKTGEMRQVMVFIADEGRILLNSHFTANGFMIAPASNRHRQMKVQLEDWIARSGTQSAGTGLQR